MPDTWFAATFAGFDGDYVFIVGHWGKNNHNILVVRSENTEGIPPDGGVRDRPTLTCLFFMGKAYE